MSWEDYISLCDSTHGLKEMERLIFPGFLSHKEMT